MKILLNSTEDFFDLYLNFNMWMQCTYHTQLNKYIYISVFILNILVCVSCVTYAPISMHLKAADIKNVWSKWKVCVCMYVQTF